MKKVIQDKISVSQLTNRRFKSLVLIAFLILVWVGVIKLISGYVASSVDDNWNEILNEKIASQREQCTGLFNKYQNEVSEYSDKISGDEQVQKNLYRDDLKKLYDTIFKMNLPSSLELEVYNKRLELQLFKGKQLGPDYVLLQKALAGDKISVIKDIGFYTYLLVYSPINYSENTNETIGVLLTAELIDIKYHISNKFFQDFGLSNDIKNAMKVNVELIAANSISGDIQIDSIKLVENNSVDLISVDGKVIGKVLFPIYDTSTHRRNIASLSMEIISVLIFVFSVILTFLVFRSLNLFSSKVVRIILFGVFLFLIRYLWLQFNFPSKTFDSELFSPSFYASTFGYGIVKSIGELFVTSVFFLVYVLYVAKQSFLRIKIVDSEKTETKPYLKIIYSLVLTFLFFVIMDVYGTIIKSIIFDSNIRFLDKTKIIPSLDLFSVQLVVLIITFVFFVINVSIVLNVISQTLFLFTKKILIRFNVIILYFFFIGINVLIDSLTGEFMIIYMHRLIIISLVFIFCFYINRKIVLKKEFVLFSIRNFSIIVLFCIITTPLILLDKIKSQEKDFVELIATEISEQEEERVAFLISNELTNLTLDKNLERNLRDESKLSKLAFYLWAESKLNSENFNSAIIILDTNKKVISDFNVNASKLCTDSVVDFVNKKFFKFNFETTDTAADTSLIDEDAEIVDEESEETEEGGSDQLPEDDIYLPVIFDNINILKNPNEKYYVGISPIEIPELRYTQYSRILGYILIAVHSESKNLLPQSSQEIFKNYTKDNLLDKLISEPVITEFLNGKVINSTNIEVSRSNAKSLEPFREYLKNANEKKSWRFETINDDRYETFYMLSQPLNIDEIGDYNTGVEKIYAISLRREDVTLTTFYYLKFILFTVFVYVILYIIFGLTYVYRVKRIRLTFREKLFVSFFIVSVIPIILLAIYTRSFIINKNETNLKNQIVSDLNLINESLRGKYYDKKVYKNTDSLKVLYKDILGKSFNESDKNFNLYIKNDLVSTTNEELYKSDLLDTRIDADAFYNIAYLKKDLFIKTQDIGGFSFLVGYKPFKDENKSIVGFISSQSVYKQNEMNEELTETMTFIFGIYFIVIIILLILVSFFTERISKPILELQEATEKLSRGQSNVEIKTKRSDEMGALVKSFNKMTKDLERSKRELKKAEREAAWRDIARRVAHEIKNPLTPMKLSIQHLYDFYKEKKGKNFEALLTKTKDLIYNEVDKLNRIATEFSDFAKLPGRDYKPVDVNNILEDVISLYSLDPRVEFKKSLQKRINYIYGDRQELNRVFQNLVKNAIQALDGSGIVEIKSYQKDKFVFVEVNDNGSGMEPEVLNKLFEPNFSTKTRGMGLGLAITKKSLDDMKAIIEFQSELNVGTQVTIRFNVYEENNKK